MRKISFSSALEDVTKFAVKIPREKYLDKGVFPIIDQSKDYIAGYWNDSNGLFNKVPAIAFGDHTRAIKYITTPFYIGADGVKILKVANKNDNPKYYYYALQAARIPDLGYSRHFKIVRELMFNMYKRPEQDNIVKRLDKLESLIALKNHQLNKLDELIKSRFIEMFGHPMNDTFKWKVSTIGEQFDVTSGGTPATGEKAFWDNGTIPWIGSNMCQDTILYENDGKFITEEGYAHSSAKWFYSGTVLVALVGATIGKTALLQFDTTTNQNIAAINVNGNKNFSSEYIFYHLQLLYEKFMEIGNGKFKMANQGFIKQLLLICPPLDLQNQFSALVKQVNKSKLAIEKSIEKLEILKKSLMQEYFG